MYKVSLAIPIYNVSLFVERALLSVLNQTYDNIEYLPNSGDFLVQSNNKVGIISSKKETKIQLL